MHDCSNCWILVTGNRTLAIEYISSNVVNSQGSPKQGGNMQDDLKVDHRDVAKMLASSLPVEGEEFGQIVENHT